MSNTLTLRARTAGAHWVPTMGLRFIQKRERYILQQQMVAYGGTPREDLSWFDVPLIKDAVPA